MEYGGDEVVMVTETREMMTMENVAVNGSGMMILSRMKIHSKWLSQRERCLKTRSK